MTQRLGGQRYGVDGELEEWARHSGLRRPGLSRGCGECTGCSGCRSGDLVRLVRLVFLIGIGAGLACVELVDGPGGPFEGHRHEPVAIFECQVAVDREVVGLPVRRLLDPVQDLLPAPDDLGLLE